MSVLNEKFRGKVFVFDADGTLLDSMPTANGVVLSYLDERGVVYPNDLIATLTPLGFVGVANYYVQTLGIQDSAENIFRCFSDKLKRLYAEEIPLKESVKETLLALRAQNVRCCILTGSPHEFVDACFVRTGLTDLTEYVWTVEDFSMQKSEPQIFVEVAKRLGVPVTDLVMVDDNIHVLRAASKVGVATVGVFEECTSENEADMRAFVDRYVYKMSEILE